jgi:tetratricopeptide (TPR) repeat protein
MPAFPKNPHLPLLVAAALLACAPPAAAQQWVEVRSKNFSLITDAGEKRGREVVRHFEQMHAAFGALFQRTKVQTPAPLEIIAFRDSKQMRPYLPLWEGKPVEMSGFFQSSEDVNFIALDLSSGGGWRVVFHEYAHSLLNANLPSMPPWFDEGYAEYCSSLRVTGKKVEFGLVPEDRARVLARASWLRLLELLTVKREDRIYNSGDHRSVFYAQSWITVHYFMAHGMMQQVSAYLDLVENRKLAPAEAVRMAFKMDAEQLQSKVREYYTRGRLTYYRVAAPADMEGSPYAVRPLDSLEVQATLADLHYHSKDYHERGIAEFKEILARQPDNPVANRGLGYEYLRENDFDRAAECFRRAAATDSGDPRVHYLAALLRSREAMIAARQPSNLGAMRQELEKAIALDPGYADAYNLMAYVQATSGDLEGALAAAEKAVQLSPRNDMYLANLVTYQLQAQKWEAAAANLRRLKNSDNAEIAAAAARNLAQLGETPQARPTRQPAQPSVHYDPTAPQWRPKPGEEPPPPEPTQPEETPAPSEGRIRPIAHFYGTLLSVDCSPSPAAVLTIQEGGKTWKMRTRDRHKLLLIGVDKFSCGWRNEKVLVNFRETGPGEANLVTLELK